MKFMLTIAAVCATASPALSGPADDYSTREGCMRALAVAMPLTSKSDAPIRREEERLRAAPPEVSEEAARVIDALKARDAATLAWANAIMDMCAAYPQ
ncbi:hypothetical protein SAMN05877809_105292 [Rhodobacter sp. JA431]|uniref:hypothetical protein n=1 Tax=Rhodobacter sp. JA431 TaxID=570013 RepID=UPI000BD301C6|nr:hypothetical protein [Rhodobacter sp. JA431]SOC11463.1 hypothetical protein SAMN05877809_105292 [Rhodobacter sp. JA431]